MTPLRDYCRALLTIEFVCARRTRRALSTATCWTCVRADEMRWRTSRAPWKESASQERNRKSVLRKYVPNVLLLLRVLHITALPSTMFRDSGAWVKYCVLCPALPCPGPGFEPPLRCTYYSKLLQASQVKPMRDWRTCGLPHPPCRALVPRCMVRAPHSSAA